MRLCSGTLAKAGAFASVSTVGDADEGSALNDNLDDDTLTDEE